MDRHSLVRADDKLLAAGAERRRLHPVAHDLIFAAGAVDVPDRQPAAIDRHQPAVVEPAKPFDLAVVNVVAGDLPAVEMLKFLAADFPDLHRPVDEGLGLADRGKPLTIGRDGDLLQLARTADDAGYLPRF